MTYDPLDFYLSRVVLSVVGVFWAFSVIAAPVEMKLGRLKRGPEIPPRYCCSIRERYSD